MKIARMDRQMDALTDGRTDDGRKVITIAHPEQSSGELKKKKRTKKKLSFLHATFLLDLIYVPIKYYQITSNSMVVKACTRFRFQGT